MSYNPKQIFSFIENCPPYPQTYGGQGIVISGGGSYLASAYVGIKSLRHWGCTLPIQMWYLGRKEFPEVLDPIFTKLGVQTVNCFEIQKIHPFSNLGGWQSKPYSIVHCPFKEVLSFDADNFALINPEFLFSSEEYKKVGSIFWPDFHTGKQEYWSIKPQAWELLGLTPQKNLEIETGQLLIDKEKCWKSLLIALHMNEHSDFYYNQCTYGDTDTYTLSWLLNKQESYRVPTQPKLQEEMVRIQYSPDGKELFQHSRKWVLPADVNLKLSSYQHEELCLNWLRELEYEIRQIA